MSIINNSKTDPNKILPIRYPWAREHYKAGVANNWIPEEISMQKDIEQWKSDEVLNETERRLILWNLGFFSTAESLTANNIVLALYNHVTDPACRQYMLRQAYEEAVHCYIEGTEVLTPRGFVDFRDLQKDEKVAQYDESGNISFVHPHVHYSDHYDGTMYAFSNESETYNKIVTEDHKCPFFDERDGHRLKIQLAKDISTQNKQFPVSGKLKAGSREFTDWDRLRIAFQADGTLVNAHQKDLGSRSGYLVWSFNLKRQRKKDRLRMLANSLGLKIKEYPLPEKHGKVGHSKFSVWVPLDQACNKDFEWFSLDEISDTWIEQFISELAHWDGSQRPKGICYTTTNRSCMEKVTLLSHLCGRRAGIHEAQTIVGNPVWQVHIHNKHYVSGKTLNKETIEYNGQVYCVGVPSGLLVVRYKGNIMISGNTDTFIYCCDTFGFDPEDIYTMYQSIPSIKAKDDYVVNLTKVVFNKSFEIKDEVDIRKLLNDLIGFYVIMEGIFFYAGFAMMLALKRQGKMVGLGEQFEYIMRDESLHLAFGCDVISTIIAENPGVWIPEIQTETRDLIANAVKLEKAYVHDACPNGLLGFNPDQFCTYVEYIADRRLERLGLDKHYGSANPFPWMSQAVDLPKEKNFFETRVTEYRVGALEW